MARYVYEGPQCPSCGSTDWGYHNGDESVSARCDGCGREYRLAGGLNWFIRDLRQKLAERLQKEVEK